MRESTGHRPIFPFTTYLRYGTQRRDAHRGIGVVSMVAYRCGSYAHGLGSMIAFGVGYWVGSEVSQWVYEIVIEE